MSTFLLSKGLSDASMIHHETNISEPVINGSIEKTSFLSKTPTKLVISDAKVKNLNFSHVHTHNVGLSFTRSIFPDGVTIQHSYLISEDKTNAFWIFNNPCLSRVVIKDSTIDGFRVESGKDQIEFVFENCIFRKSFSIYSAYKKKVACKITFKKCEFVQMTHNVILLYDQDHNIDLTTDHYTTKYLQDAFSNYKVQY